MTEVRKYPKITLTGDLGGGKSAISKMLKEELGFEIFSTGNIMRKLAEKRQMSVLEFNQYAESRPEIDDEIDAYSKRMGEEQRSFIMDSRLAWNFMPHSFKVFLTVQPEIAAQRIIGDQTRGKSEQYSDIMSAKAKLIARRESELKRFKALYHIDYSDFNNYDLVVDTSFATPKEVFEIVHVSFLAWMRYESIVRFWLCPKTLIPLKSDRGVQEGGIQVLKNLHRFFIVNGADAVLDGLRHRDVFLPVSMPTFEEGEKEALLKTRLSLETVQAWEEELGFSSRESK